MILFRLQARRYVYSIRCCDVSILFDDPYFHGLHAGLPFRTGQESEKKLTRQPLANLIEKRLKANRRSEPYEIGFASGFIGQLSEEVLTPVHSPETVAIVSN